MSGRIVLAGSASNVGKTTLAAGLIAALCRRGLAIQPFKVGPDYIDPTYHTLAAGLPSRNLDSWLLPHDRVCACFAHATRNAEVAIIEGMMGLYDGQEYRGEAGSTAEVAKLLDAPVIVVLDVTAQARSAAATALGFLRFDPAVRIAGFICNRTGGAGHYRGVKAAIEDATGLPVLGGVPQTDAVAIPERHLGLTPTDERGDLQPLIAALADLIADTCDLDALLGLARNAPPLAVPVEDVSRIPEKPTTEGGDRPVIAVARDRAFSFYYEDNLDLLRLVGAEIVPFSPLADARLPERTAGLYIGGGFPEIYAAELAANDTLRAEIRDAVTAGLPCYAECGGLMYLTEALVDGAGGRYPMVGLLPGDAMMGGRWPKIGYTTVRALRDTPLLRIGEEARGHEFHYSTWENIPADTPHAYTTRDGRGEHLEGYACGNLLTSYVHLHFWGTPALAARFVQRSAEERGPR
ncbi:MAG: cobyrinate a,c-diamide synthase [Chloroflexota bacterium]|nr:cobyrinate a,c-diamide synthase [Chloroflexota bacterium]MDQ6908753.1 cobyrinate a,c-diamide synthase [Chloroflexota bacterium]